MQAGLLTDRIIIEKPITQQNGFGANAIKWAEFVILTLDLATCPFLEEDDKLEFLKLMGLEEDQAKQACSLLEKQKFMFTKWTGVNVTKELSAKISQEVYS